MRSLVPTSRTVRPVSVKPEEPIVKYRITDTDRIVSYNNENYLLLLPPRTGSRSIYKFLAMKGILDIPITDHIVSNHNAIQDDFVGKIIVSTRHPLDRVISGYFLAKLKTPDLTIDEMIAMIQDYDACIFPGIKWDDDNIITNLLRGRTPDYIIHTETLTADLLNLPFIDDVSNFPHIHEDATLPERITLKNYLISNREHAEKINRVFDIDFATFGYDKI